MNKLNKLNKLTVAALDSFVASFEVPFAVIGNDRNRPGDGVARSEFNNRGDELRARLVDLNAQAREIQATADARGDGLSTEEREQLDGIFTAFEAAEDELSKRDRVDAMDRALGQGAGRRSEPQNTAPASRGDGVFVPPERHPGRAGFNEFGDFLQAVRNAAAPNQPTDQRLLRTAGNAPSSVSSEGTGADGGFAVPPEWRDAIAKSVLADDALLPRTDDQQSGSNSVTFPKDDTTPWASTGGIQAYWDGEQQQGTESKVNLGANQLRLNKLRALVPVTDELLEDSTLLAGYVMSKTPEVMNHKIDLAIIQGTGAGQPLGILNSGATISVAKESGQAADTLTAQNVIDMWSRGYGPARSRAVWLVNQDIETQLVPMAIRFANAAANDFVGGQLVYMPPGGLSASPYGSLMGRPVIPTEACNTLGDKGDIILADLGSYLTVRRSSGIRESMSMHLYFDYDISVFKFVFRLAGQPWRSTPIDGRDSGSPTRSPFVTLAERA